jgi:tight adherence protein C
MKLVLGATSALLGLLMVVSSPALWRILVAAAITVFGWFLPDILLYNTAEHRRIELRRALPDTLDQMTISVEAGLAFEAAMTRAGRSGDGPLNRELQRTMQDVQVGMSRAEALKGLAERTDVDEIEHFVVAVVQAESHGVPISRVLRVQSSEQRLKRRQRAEENAMKLPVKILFPLVLCILPTIFIVLLGPAVIRMVEVFG